jgi:hypothetical protein
VLRAETFLIGARYYYERSDQVSSVFVKTGSICDWSGVMRTSLRACAKVGIGTEITWKGISDSVIV